MGEKRRERLHPIFAGTAAHRGWTTAQTMGLICLVLIACATALVRPMLASFLILAIQIAYVGVATWRLALLAGSQRPDPAFQDMRPWPPYTIVAALYDEAAVVGQLVQRLGRIDYPVDRLDGWLVLEEDDQATLDAARALVLPSWLQILVVPPGAPATKPRALNHALAVARGEYLAVYDAEDDPHPQQLKEAASRFSASDHRLACLQAPLRVRFSERSRSPFLDRQYAAEYAALFEVILPAMARMGLPFPLGGTSNHLRVSALQHVGGWDAWNVTEDADLGFRLARAGWRSGVIARPTYETPPGALRHWLPQRTRWLKGYLQTLAVHSRDWRGMGCRGWIGLHGMISVTLTSSAMHAVTVTAVLNALLIAALSRDAPALPAFGLSVLLLGSAAAWLTAAVGARRAGLDYRLRDMATTPFYWSLLTLAFAHALVRVIVEPYRWDKTSHAPDQALDINASQAGHAAVAGREPA